MTKDKMEKEELFDLAQFIRDKINQLNEELTFYQIMAKQVKKQLEKLWEKNNEKG